MSTQILPAYYTTTNLRQRKSKSKVTGQVSKHDLWLRKNGVHPDQIRAKKTVDVGWKKRYNETMVVEGNDYESAGMSGNSASCLKRDIMTNLHKEPENVRKEILMKASRVMPLFNKGGLQYATPGEDLTQVGSKSRRG